MLPVLFWRLLCTIDATNPVITSFFQIWSTLANGGYKEIALGFEPITNVEKTSMYNNEQ